MSQKCRKNMVNYYKRENKNGTCYQATIRIKGYNILRKTFKKKSDAQNWAEPIEQAMKKGTYIENTIVIDANDFRQNIILMSDLITYFRENIAQERYSSPEKYNVMFEWWIDKIGSIKVRELSASMLSSCKQILATEKIIKKKKKVVRGNNTINKYLMCLSAVLTYAVKELELINVNPMSKIKLMQKPTGRTRFLSDDEIEKLKSVCKEHSEILYLFYLLLLKTGGRFNEVRHLEIKDIDYSNNKVYFIDTKNKTHRGVHVDKNTLALLQEYTKKNDIKEGYIFSSTKRGAELCDMKGIMEQAIRKSGIQDFHIHDIRHTTASILARNGASLLEIAEILGQKSLSVARRYSHLTKKHTEELMSSIMDKY